MRLIELLFITENRKQISLSACGHMQGWLGDGGVNQAGARKPPLTKLKANTFQLHIWFTLQQSQYEICNKRRDRGRKGKCEKEWAKRRWEVIVALICQPHFITLSGFLLCVLHSRNKQTQTQQH